MPIILFGIFIVIVDLLESKKDRKVENAMALIECPECGKQISDKSKACIHCGYPIDEYRNVEIKCKYCDSVDIDEYGYCNKCGMQNFVKETVKNDEFVLEKVKTKKSSRNKKNRKKKGILSRIIFFIFLIICLSSYYSNEEKTVDMQETDILENKQQMQTYIETDVETNDDTYVVESDIETENKTEADPKVELYEDFNKYIEDERCELLCEILFSNIGFKEVEFIKKVDSTFNYEVWLDGNKGLITDTGDDFRIFIPNTNIIFYENKDVIMNAEELEMRTIDHNDINYYYIIAKTIVEDNLKNPSSAKFPSLLTNSSEIGMSKLGNLICVQSYVDATNSFGAKVRTHWTVQFTVIDLESFSYELNYIKIGDETAGEFISMN